MTPHTFSQRQYVISSGAMRNCRKFGTCRLFTNNHVTMRNMSSLVQSILLEYDNSTFFIEMLEYRSKHLYVTIEQIIHDENDEHHSEKIKINPSILEDIIEGLTFMKKELETVASIKNYFSAEKKQKVISRYLKGVKIPDLSVQFKCPEFVIKQILSNNGIEIVSPEVPKSLDHRKRRKKRNK